MNIYVLGGRQRKRWLRSLDPERRFDAAIILRLNTSARTSEKIVEYHTPAAAKAHPQSSDVFASGTLCGNRLYACTYTEVIVYDVPSFRQVGCISLPCFNSLHHVRPTRRGSLLLANTGLDMVLEITLGGAAVREWSVLGNTVWDRFSRSVDYRKVSTKPHLSHPNFVFEISEDVWVTRLCQRDAICLTRPGEAIKIDLERPHDGLLHGGLLYFTTVDGHLVVVDSISLKTVSITNLRTFRGYGFTGPAWCRGVLVINPAIVCVGFTRMRKTLLLETGNWIRHGFREVDPPTHLAVFDLQKRECLAAINLEPHEINILFGILAAEDLPKSARVG
jgi:hypothetical protein